MASIGEVSCTFVKGNPPELKLRVDVWVVPGFDGVGAQTVGKSDAPFRFTGVQFGTAEEVDTWIAAIRALQGTIVTIVNDWDVEQDNLLIQRVGQPSKIPEVGNGGARGELQVEGVRVK